MAHVEFIAKDQSKQDFLKQFMEGMVQAGKMGDEINSVSQEMLQSQQQGQGQGMSEEDIKLQYLAAKSGIEIDTKQKLADISIGKASVSHAQRTEQRKQQGITQLALQKAKARAEIQKTMAKAQPMQQAPEAPEAPEMEEEQETGEVESETPGEEVEMEQTEMETEEQKPQTPPQPNV